MRQHCCGPAVHSRRQHPHCSEQLLPVTKRACRVCPQRVSGSREASHPAAGNAQGAAPLAYTTRIASSPAELRAAAYLRAQSFYVYPSDRSEWAARVGEAWPLACAHPGMIWLCLRSTAGPCFSLCLCFPLFRTFNLS